MFEIATWLTSGLPGDVGLRKKAARDTMQTPVPTTSSRLLMANDDCGSHPEFAETCLFGSHSEPPVHSAAWLSGTYEKPMISPSWLIPLSRAEAAA